MTLWVKMCRIVCDPVQPKSEPFAVRVTRVELRGPECRSVKGSPLGDFRSLQGGLPGATAFYWPSEFVCFQLFGNDVGAGMIAMTGIGIAQVNQVKRCN